MKKMLTLGKTEDIMRRDKMVGWHHRLNGHEFEQALGDGEGQRSLACYHPWGQKESDTTEPLNNNRRTDWKRFCCDLCQRLFHSFLIGFFGGFLCTIFIIDLHELFVDFES